MAPRLQERVAFVSGAGSGMGRAAAFRFAREGAGVAAADISLASASETVNQIVAAGGEAIALHADVTSDLEVEAAVGATLARFGRLDVLLACAGVAAPFEPVTRLTVDQWEHVMAVNVRGVFLCAKHCIPPMQTQGGGTIVAIASDSAYVATPNQAVYCASKGAVLMLTRALAVDHAGDNIRINCVCPSVVDTPMVRSIFDAGDRDLADFGLPQVHTPESIAEKLLFLASDESAGISGTSLVIDFGGLARSTFPV
jgi:NAD(P)-dependent dehydrogenase (short-subunit alcohol dehydrogenase family)